MTAKGKGGLGTSFPSVRLAHLAVKLVELLQWLSRSPVGEFGADHLHEARYRIEGEKSEAVQFRVTEVPFWWLINGEQVVLNS